MTERPSKIVFTELVSEEFLKPAKISRSNADNLFAKADAIESFALGGDPEKKSVIIAERHVEGKWSPVHLLGIGFFVPPDTAQVHTILKIPAPLRSDEIAPLKTLERLLDAWGVDVTIGKRTTKLIVSDTVEIEATGKMFGVSGAPADHKIHAGSYLRVTENAGKRYADCVLCFALDQTSYLHAIEV